MFGLILISAGTLLHIYVLQRAGTVPLLRRHLTKRAFVFGGLLLWAAFLAGRIYGHARAGALASLLELTGMTWLVVLFLTAVPLLAVDIATGFGSLLPGRAPFLRGAALVCGALLSVAAAIQGSRAPVVQNYEVELASLPGSLDGTVIAGLSDLHIGANPAGKRLGQRVAQVEGMHPDIVVLLGDIFEGHARPSKENIAALRRLQARMGVWAVLGNHESHAGGSDAVPLFRAAGVSVLRNEKVKIAPGLALAGVADLTAHRRSGLKADLVTKALSAPSRDATILLSHTPWHAGRAAAAGAGLMLCGHTHGGQIWPFGYLVRLVYPLLAGRYNVDGMTVIVTRGAGTWGPHMRLWEPGEIIRVTLRAKRKEA